MQIGKVGFVPLQSYNRAKNNPSFKAALAEMEIYPHLDFQTIGYHEELSKNASINKKEWIDGEEIETYLKQGDIGILYLKDKKDFKIIRFNGVRQITYEGSYSTATYGYEETEQYLNFVELFPKKGEKIEYEIEKVDAFTKKIKAENIEILTKETFEPWAEKNKIHPSMIIKLGNLIGDVHDTMS